MRNLKLGMCYVDKGKAFTVGSRDYEVVLGFIWVFDPSKGKRNEVTLKKHLTKRFKFNILVETAFSEGLNGCVH